MTRYQSGYVFKAANAFHVRFYTTVLRDGKLVRVQKSEKLCGYDKKTHYSTTCPKVKELCAEKMTKVNATTITMADQGVVEFWEQRYLPYCQEIIQLKNQTPRARHKPSTVRGHIQIWKQHLKTHFANTTLQQYEPRLGSRFLQSLTSRQGKTTLKHIKALGSSIFKLAVMDERIKTNPWRDVQIPGDAFESERTQHYTLEESEDIISALVNHVDAQLVMALSCFLALRPGEIAALKWEDVDDEWLHIRRSVVRGIVDVPKTAESVAPLPLIGRVRVPLELWRAKCAKATEGWVFPSNNKTPVDLHNLIERVIRPHLEGRKCIRCEEVPKATKLKWKTLYAGRRGAITAAIEKTNGNFAIGQALGRHKTMTTTLNIYKKAITPQAFQEGMKRLELQAEND